MGTTARGSALTVSRVVNTEQCPKCAERGQDRRKNNLAVYEDGGVHCFSCGYHRNGKFQLTFINKETPNAHEKAVLPRSFTRTIPPEGWKWLLQYGLPYSYWAPYCGYSEEDNRLIFTHGQPIQFSQGRALSVGDSKWRFYGYGNAHTFVQCLGEELPGAVVLVEDIISSHKVAQVNPSICLFGTNIHDACIKELLRLDKPVVLWLDADQYQLLPKKIHRLQSLLRQPVRYVFTDKDPKAYNVSEIKSILQQE